MVRKSFSILFVLISLIAISVLTQEESTAKNFIVEAKVFIDNKPYNPTNLSVLINTTTSLPYYSFNLSAQNFNKNVTVGLRLFSWYNSQWILSRQTISLKIVDRRNVYSEKSHLMARILKYNSRRYESKMTDQKQQTLLNYTRVFITYDPESSLLVSRLEDPQIFNEQSNYWPVGDISQEYKGRSIKVNITFAVATRSDAFINSKNHIVSLNELSSKIKQRIPLISRPIGDQIDPKLIYRTYLANCQAIKKANKQYNEKLTLMVSRKYDGLLLPRLHRVPQPFPTIIYNTAKSFNVSIADAFVPTYYFILQQGFILDTINQLQQFLKKTISDVAGRDWLATIGEWSQLQFIISFAVASAWVVLDIWSYSKIRVNPGLSISFGYFLVAWLVVELFSLCIRIGSAFDYYHGFGSFIILLIIVKLIVSSLQQKFNKYAHKCSSFDKGITQACFNLIIMGLLANGILHVFVEKDITNGQLATWSLSEFELLLSEYYYFLAMLPPLFLSLKLKSTSHIGWIRLFLFLLVALKDDYWLLIEDHWALVVLRLKEQFVFLVILLLKIVYGNQPIQIIQVVQEKSKNLEKAKEESKEELTAQSKNNND